MRESSCDRLWIPKPPILLTCATPSPCAVFSSCLTKTMYEEIQGFGRFFLCLKICCARASCSTQVFFFPAPAIVSVSLHCSLQLSLSLFSPYLTPLSFFAPLLQVQLTDQLLVLNAMLDACTSQKGRTKVTESITKLRRVCLTVLGAGCKKHHALNEDPDIVMEVS